MIPYNFAPFYFIVPPQHSEPYTFDIHRILYDDKTVDRSHICSEYFMMLFDCKPEPVIVSQASAIGDLHLYYAQPVSHDKCFCRYIGTASRYESKFIERDS